jgi:putative salt-induced outer membrane protein
MPVVASLAFHTARRHHLLPAAHCLLPGGMPMSYRSIALLACAMTVLPGPAAAQATIKPDGRFRYALGAGASYSSGNTSAASVNIKGDAVRATADSKLRFGGTALWSRSDGATTASNIALGTQYDRDFTAKWFSFASADFLRDSFANIDSQTSLHAGVGRHLIKRENLSFDVSAGAGYIHSRYVDPAVIHGELRERWGRAEAVIAEESTHKWTSTTSFHQKLALFPALESGGGFRSVFDSGLAVAMTPLLDLTVGLSYRYDSDPGAGLVHGDTLFITGISVKLD